MMIGIYSSAPASLTPARTASLVREAEAQGVQLLFFAPAGLDENSATVQGIVYTHQIGKRQRLPLPACVIAAPGADQSLTAWQWLCRHTAVIGTELSGAYEEQLGARFRQLSRLRSPLESGLDEIAADETKGWHHFRLTLCRTAQGGWSNVGVGLPERGDAEHDTDESDGERSVSRYLQARFPGNSLCIESHLMLLAAETAAHIAEIHQAELPGLYIDLATDDGQRTRLCGAGIAADEAAVWAQAVAYAAQLIRHAAEAVAPVQRAAARLHADKPTIGMLVGWELSPLFLEACHQVAESRGARLFYFYPRRVDAEKRQIRGFHWQDGQWRKAIFPYPDVIYDRMRRNHAANAAVYESLAGIPITHELAFGSLDKLKVYRAVANDPQLAEALIPFQTLDRLEEAKRFIDLHPRFILKPLRGSNGDKMIVGTLRNDGRYEIFDQDFMHDITRAELDQLLAELRKHRYMAQRFIESKTGEGFTFHIRVHVMKDGSGSWKIAFILPSFSLTPYRKITNHAKTFRSVTKWEWFLNGQFGETLGGGVDDRVRSFALRLADFLQDCFGGGFHEAGIDMGIDEHGIIRLFEVNLNNVGMNLHEFEAAKHGVEYALWLLASRKGETGPHVPIPRRHYDGESQ